MRGKEISSTKPAMVSRNPALFTGITEPATVKSLFEVLSLGEASIRVRLVSIRLEDSYDFSSSRLMKPFTS